MGAFDRYPYTNFHELNLEYFIQHFKEIFTQWEELYDTLTAWKDSTTEELAAWETEVLADIDARETALRAELAEWKTDTEQDISDWETATLSALDDWKDAFQTLFESTFSDLSDIKTAAEDARDAAAISATAAAGSATDAAATAASLSESTAQIQTNAVDIADLKLYAHDADKRIDVIYDDYVRSIPWTLGYTDNQDPHTIVENAKYITTAEIISKKAVSFTCDEGYNIRAQFWNNNGTFRSQTSWDSVASVSGAYNYTINVRKGTSTASETFTDVINALIHVHSNLKVGIITEIAEDINDINDTLTTDEASIAANASAIDANETDIAALKSINASIPAYAETEYQAVLAKVFEQLPTSHIILGFNTDQHISYSRDTTYRQQNYDSVRIGLYTLAKMSRIIPFNVICLGGDAAGYSAPTDSTVIGILQDVEAVNEPLYDAWAPMIHIAGNHDAFQNLRGEGLDDLTGKQLFQNYLYHAWREYGITPAGTSYATTNCLMDDASTKTRYIFLGDQYNSSGSNSRSYTATFLTNSLKNQTNGGSRPDDYKMIIFSHHPLPLATDTGMSTGLGWGHLLYNPTASVEHPNVVDYRDDIIVCISGHDHKDEYGVWEGILFVGTTTAMWVQGPTEHPEWSTDNNDNVRTIGTASATAYDIYCINQTAQEIHIIRYGAGTDRAFTYGANPGPITNEEVI